jgi:predicted metal-binding membrane protein
MFAMPDPAENSSRLSTPATPPGLGRSGLGRSGLGRSRAVAIACVIALAGLGWVYLGLSIAEHVDRSGSLAQFLAQLWSGDRGLARALYDAICRPSFGHAAQGDGIGDAAIVLLMWVAMTLAMMLPTAGPMILTYADIADAATRKGEQVTSPLVLTAGYVAVWFGFAITATGLQIALTDAAILDPAMGTASPLFSGAVFIAAGAYQFSALKHACVTQCQRPFPFFLTHWTSEPRGILRLGLRQGLYCLGCCWAMMGLMLAVGIMNVVWMATLGMIMAAEKIATTTRFSRAVGGVLVLIGAVLIATAVVAQWPTHST